jgi:UDP-N-acetylglucosamine:LPS N-acetylglucosamine transferase
MEELMRVNKIDFVFFDAGGGHRSAATAVHTVIQQQQWPWEVSLVNLQEVLDPVDFVRKLTGFRVQDVYNLLLKKGWTLGTVPLLRLMQGAIRFYHREQLNLLEAHWRSSRPDLVVSFVPHFNRALCESLRNVRPNVPFVTILTDFADFPPHFWIERQEQFLICGSDRAVKQAKSFGHPEHRIFKTSGMILQPRFYEPLALDRRTERLRLGLHPDRTTGLVLFGGQGANVMSAILKRLDRSGLELQLIMICGRNERLVSKLRGYRSRLPVFVEGFTSKIPYYMRLADFFIGKPGPGSISEAIAMHLPVIVERSARTLPQERYNTEWVLEKEVGLVVSDFRRIEQAASRLLESSTLERYRANTASHVNRAVFEIPAILDKLLTREATK